MLDKSELVWPRCIVHESPKKYSMVRPVRLIGFGQWTFVTCQCPVSNSWQNLLAWGPTQLLVHIHLHVPEPLAMTRAWSSSPIYCLFPEVVWLGGYWALIAALIGVCVPPRLVALLGHDKGFFSTPFIATKSQQNHRMIVVLVLKSWVWVRPLPPCWNKIPTLTKNFFAGLSQK